VTNEAFRQLMDLAIEEKKDGETVEQAFARLHADPKYRDLVSTEKRMHSARVAKAMGAG
jgi:flagellar motility protein MotE (MotC chaperone)